MDLDPNFDFSWIPEYRSRHFSEFLDFSLTQKSGQGTQPISRWRVKVFF